MLYGVVAALLAWCIVSGALQALRGPAAILAKAYGSDFRLASVNMQQLGWLVLVGLLLGWIGAWLATASQLARIEPHS